jgi:hypothetical protein
MCFGRVAEFSKNLKKIHYLNCKSYEHLDQITADYQEEGKSILKTKQAALVRVNTSDLPPSPEGPRSRVLTATDRISLDEGAFLVLKAAEETKFSVLSRADEDELYSHAELCDVVIKTRRSITYCASACAMSKIPTLVKPVQTDLPGLPVLVRNFVGAPIFVDSQVHGVLSFFDTLILSTVGKSCEHQVTHPRMSIPRAIRLKEEKKTVKYSRVKWEEHEVEITEVMAQSVTKFVTLEQLKLKRRKSETIRKRCVLLLLSRVALVTQCALCWTHGVDSSNCPWT